jgi:hypothetical protein
MLGSFVMFFAISPECHLYPLTYIKGGREFPASVF